MQRYVQAAQAFKHRECLWLKDTSHMSRHAHKHGPQQSLRSMHLQVQGSRAQTWQQASDKVKGLAFYRSSVTWSWTVETVEVRRGASRRSQHRQRAWYWRGADSRSGWLFWRRTRRTSPAGMATWSGSTARVSQRGRERDGERERERA